AMIDQVLLFLEGRTGPVEKRLQQQMKEASAALQFERAAGLRDRLAAVRKISQRQKIHTGSGEDHDILAVSVDGNDGCGVILKVRDGKLLGQEHHYLGTALGEMPPVVLAALLRQSYLQPGRQYPATVLLSHEIDDRELFESILAERSRRRRVRLSVPVRGPKAGLVAMAGRNSHLLLEELILRKAKARQRVPEALVGLQKTLSLPVLPRFMVCFDVSTLQGSHAVAGMSAFRNGQPVKSLYRRFRIRCAAGGQDDFAMMGEAVGRYFARIARGEQELVPQLVVIDGGRGQLSAACAAVRASGAEMPPVIALAKREEEIYLPLPDQSAPYVLSRRSEALKLLQRLRNEAHRFAVEYHRKVRKKNTLTSSLETVPGIGPARSRAILRAFRSRAVAARATAGQISEKASIPLELARSVKELLNERGT
ncbi:MAG: UvrB/UvrC motif-containing protein, partial [Gemmatimonadota bacterium]|nr:UvrB/UvrC motif-containing protein [Gemmatimonadota bacterium]